ncbi:hypothetical protein AXJ14_gp197 [Geobacillus virus E3]|uniref:hypothetical protein n=1 Tax=Geobacillus virus E3 TaxID=1572712 RepID=UPI000671B2B0|nr:hypothetical protein AXJ14_gp197 [Geobacillus virus E3]AJA41516.1 hypothetical protein E3_0197 [Geobacillus virus E3]
MIQIELIPQTACLMFKLNGKLINCKFYNKLAFDHGDIENSQIKADTQGMVNEYLKTHINKMLEYYRWHDCFNNEDINTLMQLADYTEYEICKLINKFYHINTKIVDNGGVPVLKQILQLI